MTDAILSYQQEDPVKL